MTDSSRFYAELTPFYHLIYQDWDKSIQRQASALDSVIREQWGRARTVLDVSCGIGTQAIGLAALGYKITASDLSPTEIERAKAEAAKRRLNIALSVADMREAFSHHARQFDVVISCDNSIPHLLTDADILAAFRQFRLCVRSGGGCIVSVRDYEKEDLSKQQVKPYGLREENGVRWLLWQVWDPHGATYDVTLYCVEDRGGAECRTHAMRTTYYAIGITRLMELMREAGFENVERLDGRFFQPLIVGMSSGRKHLAHIGRQATPTPKPDKSDLSDKSDRSDRSDASDKPHPSDTTGRLMPRHGGYAKLRSFQTAQLVYDGTCIFCDRFVNKRSRTHDQMVQAARSGVQNIAEGSMASATSKKTELKLTNVARASLEELLLDYQDFLRQRELPLWDKNSPQALAVRGRYASDKSDRSDRSDRSDPSDSSDPYGLRRASPEAAANTLICLINQASFLLGRQLQKLEQSFLTEGGFTERLYRERSNFRRNGDK